MSDVPVFLNVAALERLRSDARALLDARQAADEVLRGPSFTVTAKTKTPPSGDKRDYVSLGPYWWPNPGTPNGLPYVRRDGEVNPDSLQTDRQVMEAMIAAVQSLAAAWWLTKDYRYAEGAAELLRVFFLDKNTRMNPNLNFGQAIPGHCDGRGIGIIDTRVLAGLLDHVMLMRDTGTIDKARLRAWFRDFGRWLRESPLGIAESKEHNNHGTWYDVQAAAFALYAGDFGVAHSVLREVAESRIDPQLAPDGSQPHEIARTLGLSYSTMNLCAFFWLGKIGERVGVDVWNGGGGGRSIRKSLDFLLPFWLEPARWKTPQIKKFDSRAPASLLRLAADLWQDPRYEAAAKQLGADWRIAFECAS